MPQDLRAAPLPGPGPSTVIGDVTQVGEMSTVGRIHQVLHQVLPNRAQTSDRAKRLRVSGGDGQARGEAEVVQLLPREVSAPRTESACRIPE